MSEQVSAEEVGKYYLKAELSKLFPEESVREVLDNRIDNLADQEFWRLLEALSFSYRLNGMFWFVSDESYDWSEAELPAENLILTGINPQVNKVIDLVEQNPFKLRDYLKQYFEQHPDDDPEGLDQFRPSNREILYPIITLREDEGKMLLIDGSNRLMAMLLQGQEKVKAYVGRKVREGKMWIGDSTFWLMARMWYKASPEDKPYIEKVVELMVKESSDGKSAVQSYWVEHARDQDLKQIGEKLLKDQ